ncbi:MAG: PD40 domain-containing protein [Deltaproteobacteria bacterium]|nr:PD40 domain-containing protein [Deltaproteobacteria bacterium]
MKNRLQWLLLGMLGIVAVLGCSHPENAPDTSSSEPAEPSPESPTVSTPIEGVCPPPEVIQRTANEGEPTASRPRTVANACPEKFMDGEDEEAVDLYVQSCHSVLVECATDENALSCGKRALESGDWETALEQFSTGEAEGINLCEATYGRFLARLFRLYADANHLFFDDVIELNLNRHKRLRALYMPTSPLGATFHKHFDCLNRDQFWERTSQPTLIEQDLQEIWANDCTLADLQGEPLPIRWVQGKCEAPLSDAVYAGVWDKVDAALIYQFGPGNPPVTIRATVANLYSGPNEGDCPSDTGICDPLFVIDPEGSSYEIPRLPKDAEEFLALNDLTLRTLDDPDRNPNTVFAYEDTDQDGSGSLGDKAIIRACDPTTGKSVYDFSNVTVGAQWKYEPAPAPVAPSPRRIEIFCGPYDEGGEPCPVFEGERALHGAFPPLPIPNEYVLSPDGKKLAYTKEIEGGFHQIYVTEIPKLYEKTDVTQTPEISEFIDLSEIDSVSTEIQEALGFVNLEEEKIGITEAPCYKDGEKQDLTQCCVTCAVWPGGFQTGLFENQPNLGALPQWIHDLNGEPVALFFLANDHPSSWGWQGQAQGAQFYAIRLDGTGLSPLLPENIPPSAWGFQAHVSPDGQNLFWTGNWNPTSELLTANTLLLGDLRYNTDTDPSFQLKNIRLVLPAVDQGIYEANGISPQWPDDPSLFFTTSSFSKHSLRTFMGTLGENGIIQKFTKLNWPAEISSESFVIDNHPAWYEHTKLLDNGRQLFFISSQGDPSYSEKNLHFGERFDAFLQSPPYYDGFYQGLSLAEVRFLSVPGYYTEDFTPYYIRYWISNIDGTDQELITGPEPERGGWITHSVGIHNGEIYFIQSRDKDGKACRLALSKNKCERRYGVVRFL